MTLFWVVTGTVLQIFLAYFLFMLAAFAGGGLANGNSLKPIQIKILDMSLFALPGLCVLSAGIVIVLYNQGASANSYWWYLMPVIAAVTYFKYAMKVGKR